MLVWIDFENAPHVWVFKEFIERFRKDNIDVLITARNFSYTLQLCDYFGLKPIIIDGKCASKSNLSKLKAIIDRGLKLKEFIKKINIKPILSISHGSRSQAFASYLCKIKSISLDDYEHSFKLFNYFISYLLTPFPIKPEKWGIFKGKVINYPGLKEELYLFNSDNYTINELEIFDNNYLNVVFRPESNLSHYSSKLSLELQQKLIERFSEIEGLNIVVLPRNIEQKNELVATFKDKNIRFSIPKYVLNGAALIYNSDIVIGGGGTMTREAAILGIPSYSFFGGKLGEVDIYLNKIGKLNILRTKEDINNIIFKKHKKALPKIGKEAFNFVYDFFLKNLKI
ncbi:MAG: DUF354 domain-containing protein [Candidatus Woesearchaeota archaeon]